MGNAASVFLPKRRYKDGMYVNEYWEKNARPSVQDTLDVLHLAIAKDIAQEVDENFILLRYCI